MKGKTALITGGSAGIGKATAFALRRRGVRVCIVSRRAQTGQQAEAELRQAGIEATWLQADVADAQEAKRAVQAAHDLYGRLDFAVNNAKSAGEGGMVAEIEETEWEKTVQGALSTVFYCMKYELQVMLAQGGGVIVNMASVDGLRGFAADPAYSAAKHGVIGLTKSAALQYATKGVRINALCPSWVGTKRIRENFRRFPELEEQMRSHQPIGRLAEPSEIAAAVVWLCSDEASFVHGAAVPVDGGYTAM